MALTVVLAAVAAARRRGPASYPRGGSVHLRLWAAEAAADAFGAASLAGAPWISYYARALGAKVGRGVDLHALPPVTGLLTLGAGASIEPEVDLSGHWIDGDVAARRAESASGAGASVGLRSILLPGRPGRAGRRGRARQRGRRPVPPGELWAGSPAARLGVAHRRLARDGGRPTAPPVGAGLRRDGRSRSPPCRSVSSAAGLAVLWPALRGTTALRRRPTRSSPSWSLPATIVALVVHALLTLVVVRLLGLGLHRGPPPGPQPHRLAGVGDRAADGRRPHLPLPDLRQPAHAGLAALARRPASGAGSRPPPCCCCRG